MVDPIQCEHSSTYRDTSANEDGALVICQDLAHDGRIATICSSVKRLFFMDSSLVNGSHFLKLRLDQRTWAGQGSFATYPACHRLLSQIGARVIDLMENSARIFPVQARAGASDKLAAPGQAD